MLTPRKFWSQDEIETIRARYPEEPTSKLAAEFGTHEKPIYNLAKRLGLKKSDAFLQSANSDRIQRGRSDPRMMATQFKPGQLSWNKGMKGLHIGGLATQFKPGRPPSEAKNYKPIGSVRLSKDNYLECKVSDDRTVSRARRWVGVHRIVWEKFNGSIPAGHAVVFRKGMRTTNQHEITIDRLELISRADLMRRNTVHNYPPEIAKLVQLRGALIRQINHQEKEPV